ncbi:MULTISPECIES: DUF5995 family protein [Haloferax]|uniref:Uncharacterized protein n=1 Tax=Haloferax marinum TaxID=2666143 RepID=A0A6A8G576_9EURY|nr:MULTISPECIES: DUF5995 family protein [Haloferax]KAB1197275.1 hypothetical protein Hfx1150_07015 [Haloferax sp. CBA1150]MRW96314.1 hypothetical protein [Haloferax marinum]
MRRTTLTEGRKLATAVRTSNPSLSAVRPDPSSEILRLVEAPFRDVADAHDRLVALESLLYERGDRRAAFLTIYARVTAEVDAGLEDEEFADSAWVAAYLVTFADHYRRAFYAFERGRFEAVPDPWRLAFETALSGHSLVTQDVLLGINAHVNYDLALALSEVGIDPDRRAKYEDHCRINHVLQRLVDEEQDLIAERYADGVADIDESLGRLDETLSFFTLREGRRNAWRGAVALTDGRYEPVKRAVRWFLRSVTMGAGHFILAPTANATLRDRLERVENGGGGQ